MTTKAVERGLVAFFGSLGPATACELSCDELVHKAAQAHGCQVELVVNDLATVVRVSLEGNTCATIIQDVRDQAEVTCAISWEDLPLLPFEGPLRVVLDAMKWFKAT